nr:hypothetical protein [Bacillus benzoevorans]
MLDTGERQGAVVPTTVDQDIAVYTVLSERNRETFDVIELAYGQFAQDFASCSGYRVNPETKTLEYSYPDPGVPEAEPVFQAPLSEQVNDLKQKLDIQDAVIEDLMFNIIPSLTGGM